MRNSTRSTSHDDQRQIDLVSDMQAFAPVRRMEMEVEARTGAAPGARSADRKTYRNGYRERAWGEAGQKSRADLPPNLAGRIDLDIPKLRKGAYFTSGPLIDPPDRSLPLAPGAHSSSPAGRPGKRWQRSPLSFGPQRFNGSLLLRFGDRQGHLSPVSRSHQPARGRT